MEIVVFALYYVCSRVQEFETAAYLALHLPEDLENFTEDAFMLDIHCPKISERDSKICALETRFCAFHYTRQTKVWNVFSDLSRSAGPAFA